MRISAFPTLLLVTVSALALESGGALAQTTSSGTSSADSLPEVVVTAQRRSEDLQKAAAAVSVRSGDELLAQGKYELSQILEDVPGLVGGAASSASGLPNSPVGTDNPASGLTIRGIPSNVGVAGTTTSVATSAAIYVDGVYNGLGGGYDIGQVEVLRGPQGTLYGRSATTGVVAIHTPNPDLTKMTGFLSVEEGNYDLQHYSGAASLPLIDDTLALRVSGNRYSRDGYETADGGALLNADTRIKLLYQPTDTLSVLLGYAEEQNTLHTGGLSLSEVSPNQTVATPAPISSGSNSSHQFWGEFNWSRGDVTLTYEPAFRNWRSDALNIQTVPALHLQDNQKITTPKDDFITQELRLASASGGPLSWQIGALYYQNRLDNTVTTVDGFSSALEFNSATNKKTTAAGGFGEATYAIADTWRFTGGLRYDYTEVQVAQTYRSNVNLCCGGPLGSPTYGLPEIDVSQSISGEAGTRRFYNTTYKARVEHDLTPQSLVYALTTTGFSPGDVALTTGANGAPTTVPFNAETLTSYEIGSKNRFFDNRLQLNAAAFYYDYGGYQVANVNVSTIPGLQAFTSISAPARAEGGEAEFSFRITPSDRVALNLAYTHAYFVDPASQIVPGTGGQTIADYFARSSIPGVVPFTAQISYEHTFDLPGGSALTLHGDTRYLSSHDEGTITQAQQAEGAEAYARTAGQVIGNLNGSWYSADGTLSITAYARNIGDNRYKYNVVFVPGAPGSFAAQNMLYDPLTFGVVLSARM